MQPLRNHCDTLRSPRSTFLSKKRSPHSTHPYSIYYESSHLCSYREKLWKVPSYETSVASLQSKQECSPKPLSNPNQSFKVPIFLELNTDPFLHPWMQEWNFWHQYKKSFALPPAPSFCCTGLCCSGCFRCWGGLGGSSCCCEGCFSLCSIG